MKKVLACLLMVPVMAHAQFITGNKLLGYLDSTSTIENTHGWGYIIGVFDSFGSSFCTGGGATVKQVSDVVHKYLRDNPAQRNMDASLLVMVALGTAFPCPKNNKGERRS